MPEIIGAQMSSSPINNQCSNLTSEIIKLIPGGIWALINETNRMVYLVYSNSMVGSLARNLTTIKDGWHRYKNLCADINNLEFKVIEIYRGNDLENRLRLNYWFDYYRNNGYQLYNKNIPVKVWINIELYNNSGTYAVLVRLVNSKRKFLVGAFLTKDEADGFIETYYSKGIYNVIKDNGPLTQIMDIINGC